jgi:hypothetical protein
MTAEPAKRAVTVSVRNVDPPCNVRMTPQSTPDAVNVDSLAISEATPSDTNTDSPNMSETAPTFTRGVNEEFADGEEETVY